MSILRKALTTAALATALMAQGAYAETVKIAIVVKALGIGFFEAAAKGAEEAAAELGDVEIIYTGPTDTTAEGQIEVINALIAQGGCRGARAAKGDGAWHYGNLVGFGRCTRGPPDAPEPIVQRADRQYDHQTGGGSHGW
jgi:hypothetical protein